jgi:chemotaxis signal transduction protein
MKTVVRFRTPRGDFAVPVEYAREVRRAEIALLPEPRTGVAGVMPRGDDVITVLSRLGDSRPDGGGVQVLVLDAGNGPFGLLVDEVTGVVRIADNRFVDPPPGVDDAVVESIVRLDTGLVLVIALRELCRDISPGWAEARQA